MLALWTNDDSTALQMPSGATIPVPQDVVKDVDSAMVFHYALRWSLKAGLINHAEFLAARDQLVGDLACEAVGFHV